jgi:pimeloyl-ACP methyl ester carboxylesterase
MNEPIPAWPGELVDSGVGQFFVRTAPAEAGAESALFVHGLGGSARNWTDLMDLLRQSTWGGLTGPGLACEAIDLPGFGHSPVTPDGSYSIGAHAAAVIALIERRRNWPVHLVGNSLGGAVVTRVAARRPDLVRTLTLISPALPDLRPRTVPLRVTILCVPGIGTWMMNAFRRLPPEARSARTIQDVYRYPRLIHPQRRAEETAELARRDELGYANDVLIASARGLVAEYAKRGAGSLWHEAARVTAPTLVIHGSHDKLVNPAASARAARVFRNARAVVLPQVGHVAMMERPDLVAREMRELVAASPSVALAG